MVVLGPGTVITDVHKQWLLDNGGTLIDHKLLLQFANYPTSVIMKSILPPGLRDPPTSFERAGHIAHVNLRDEMLPHKTIIGERLVINLGYVITRTSLVRGYVSL